MPRSKPPTWSDCQFQLGLAILGCCIALVGCNGTSESSDAAKPSASASESQPASEPEKESTEPIGAVEIDAQKLLEAALPDEQLADGWIRLFDGQSLFGWVVAANANWSVNDGVIHVDQGEVSFLCTSFELADYEFKVDFRCDADTNSGIFLRTGLQPEDVGETCLELNIAPPDNPFPTGSFVKRKKLEPEELGDFDPTQWHTYHVRLVGRHVEVSLDGQTVMELDDFESNATGHISLQHNSGRVEFKDVMLRPVSADALPTGANWQEAWTKSVKEGATMEVSGDEQGLKMVGGLGQLQSKEDYGNFLLQANYTLARPDVNSGIFFRCVRDAMLDGYECQVNHAIENDDPLQPGDAGAGAIFRRANARIVVGQGTSPSYITLLANGPQIATWVNGIQVTDFIDSREPDENPRKGLRLEAGPISLQAHDESTDVTFHSIQVTPLGP